MNLIVTFISGIGNVVMFLPTLKGIREAHSDAHITVLTRFSAGKEILDASGLADDVYVLNETTPQGLMARLRFLIHLRNRQYDVGLTPFSLNRLGFNVLGRLLGARRRIGYRYGKGYCATAGFLHTETIRAVPGMHEVLHNLKLLEALDAGTPRSSGGEPLLIPVSTNTREFLDRFLRAQGVTPKTALVGVHPGSSSRLGDELKNWGDDNFARLARAIVAEHGVKVVFFGVKDELRALRTSFSSESSHVVFADHYSILQNAAILGRCQLFIGNDSGPMHIAVSLGVPTIALFGPSDPTRNGYHYGKFTVLKSGLDCQPCKSYPHFQYGGSNFQCRFTGEERGKCLKMITPANVVALIGEKYESCLTLES